MVVPSHFKLAKYLNETIIDDEALETLINADEPKILKNRKIVSRISKFYENFEV